MTDYINQRVDPVVFELGDGRSLTVNVTDEGIIIDAYNVDADGNGVLVGTHGMTADEWHDTLTPPETVTARVIRELTD